MADQPSLFDSVPAVAPPPAAHRVEFIAGIIATWTGADKKTALRLAAEALAQGQSQLKAT